MQAKTLLVCPDTHVPYHDRDAWNCFLKAIDIVKPDMFVHIGDFAESESVSHWQWKKKKKPPLEYQLEIMHKEIEVINRYMDIVDEALKKNNVKEKIYIQGNHDKWWDSMVEENSVLSVANRPDGFGYGYEWHEITRLKERGYKYYPYGKDCMIGKLYLLHGDLYGGQYQCANNLKKLGVNCMFGHWHTIQQHSITHLDGEKSAWCIGGLKSMEYDQHNEFTKGRPLNWGHGFAIVYFFENGLFTVNQVRIIDGQCVVHGEYIDGRKKKNKKKRKNSKKAPVIHQARWSGYSTRDDLHI